MRLESIDALATEAPVRSFEGSCHGYALRSDAEEVTMTQQRSILELRLMGLPDPDPDGDARTGSSSAPGRTP